MPATTALSESDQRLLRLLVTAENGLPAEIGVADFGSFSAIVEDLKALGEQSQHQRLAVQARDLLALLSPDPRFPSEMRGITTRNPAFLAPLAAAARDGGLVAGPPLGVWVGAQRPALAPGPWANAEQELKDLVSLVASPVLPVVARGALKVPYRPLAKAMGLVEVTRTDLPAVLVTPVPPDLRAIADDAACDLGPYSRMLEFFEELSFAIRAARLPRTLFELWMQQPDGVRIAERVAELRLGQPIQMRQLLAMLLPDIRSPDVRHIEVLSEFLQRLGIGFEPDPRFLAPLASPETPVHFFELRGRADKPSNGFVTATGVLNIGLAMAGADGHVDPLELEHVQLRAMARVSDEDERTRLRLRISAMAIDPPDFDRLLLRLKGLRRAAKEVIADLLVSVASTDGHVSAAEYEALQRAYRALRLGKPALDRTLEELRGDVRLAGSIGAVDRERRSELGQVQDSQRFDALRDLLLGTSTPASAE